MSFGKIKKLKFGWCVQSLYGRKSNSCIPEKLSFHLCSRGKVYNDCTLVSFEDRLASNNKRNMKTKDINQKVATMENTNPEPPACVAQEVEDTDSQATGGDEEEDPDVQKLIPFEE